MGLYTPKLLHDITQELLCLNSPRTLGLLEVMYSPLELHSHISSFPHTQHCWNMSLHLDLSRWKQMRMLIIFTNVFQSTYC